MAGIGQPFTPGDQSVPWNSSQVQFSMGRTVAHDTTSNALNKTFVPNFQSGPDKRPMYSEENGDAMHNSPYNRNIFYTQAGSTSEKDLFSMPPFVARNGESSTGGSHDVLSRVAGSSSRIPAPPHHLSLDGTVSSQAVLQASIMSRTAPIFPQSSGSFPTSSGAKVSGRGVLFAGGLSVGGGPPSSGSGSTTPVTLDPSEFPSLSNRGLVTSGLSGHSMSLGGIGGPINPQILSGASLGSSVSSVASSAAAIRNYVNVMSKGHTSEQNEFTIQQEDFPALPGAQNPPSATTPSSVGAVASSSNSSAVTMSSASGPGSVHHSQESYMSLQQQAAVAAGQLPPPHSQQQPGQTSLLGQQQSLPINSQQQSGQQQASQAFQSIPVQQQQQPTGPPRMILHPNSQQVSNIPNSMIHDPFGMVGLLKLMKVGESDQTLNLLAPGIDLTGLGVNVGQSADIHPNFVSPWQESCIGRPQDLDYPVPPEYKIRHLISDILPDPSMNKLTDETLFWIFYNCTKEESQLAAAKELYNRDWRFHRKELVWLTRANNGDPPQQLNGMERGVYSVWDNTQLKKLSRQLTLNYTDLDTSPRDSKVVSLTYGLPLHHPKQQGVVLQQQQNPVSVASQLAQQQPASSQHH